MFGWLKELLEIRYEFRERKLNLQDSQKVCSSCEILKIQLEAANYEKRQLLARILEPKSETQPVIAAPEPITLPGPRRHIPWSVKQQALEQEDRAKAVALRNAAKPDASVEELEKELDLAAHTRESQSGTTTNSSGNS